MACNRPPSNPEGHPPYIPPYVQIEPDSLITKVLKPDWEDTFRASRDIKPGEVLFTDRWITLYPASLSSIHVSCSGCFESLPPEKFPCQDCKVARFCSMRCQQLGHSSLLCRALHSLQSMDITFHKDLLYLLCTYSLPANLLEQFLYIRSRSQFTPEGILLETIHSKMSVLIAKNHVPLFSKANTANLLSKRKIFSFPKKSRVDPQLKVCGSVCAYGIFLKPPILRHSCIPNVAIFSESIGLPYVDIHEISCRALRDISQGNEIMVGYIPLEENLRERQKLVHKLLGKGCECERCKVESKWKRNQEGNIRTITRVRETGGVEREVQKNRDWIPIPEFLGKNVCACGGCLAYFSPADTHKYYKLINLKECNKCGAIKFIQANGRISDFFLQFRGHQALEE